MTHQTQDRIDVDPLFIGMTRPPMAMGVTYSFLVLNLMITVITFLALNNLIAFLMFIPAHAIGYLMCLKDPRIFELWRVRLMKTPPNQNHRFWQANSYRP